MIICSHMCLPNLFQKQIASDNRKIFLSLEMESVFVTQFKDKKKWKEKFKWKAIKSVVSETEFHSCKQKRWLYIVIEFARVESSQWFPYICFLVLFIQIFYLLFSLLKSWVCVLNLLFFFVFSSFFSHLISPLSGNI